MTTGLRASTFENLQLNAGMFLANFDYSTATDAATLGALLKTEREKTSGSALMAQRAAAARSSARPTRAASRRTASERNGKAAASTMAGLSS